VFVEQYPFVEAAGISFATVPIDVFRGGKKIQRGYGDVLFTHRGLSGPGILDLSRFFEPLDEIRFPICQDVADFESLLCGKKLLKNALVPLGIPDRLLQLLLMVLDISPETPAAEVDRTTRHRLKQALEGLSFVVKGLGDFDEAMVTCGGVALEDVNRQTMESRLVSGLFFCGEVLAIDGDTGGYNIQFALSSGFLAGLQKTAL
jgi:predicted Rossmann fold flavoprotein